MHPLRVLPGRYAFVAIVEARGGDHLVFRASPDPAATDQARVATALAQLGVSPRIHHVWETESGCWTVMDRVEPGTPLGNAGASALSAAELGAVLGPLDGEPAPSPTLPYIGDWLRERLEDDDLADLAPGRIVAPPDERDWALGQLADLTASGRRGLCHGDTSPGNILVGQGRTLHLIGPRGMCGEVAYDVAVLGLKSAEGHDLLERVGRLAYILGVDCKRARDWARIALAARV